MRKARRAKWIPGRSSARRPVIGGARDAGWGGCVCGAIRTACALQLNAGWREGVSAAAASSSSLCGLGRVFAGEELACVLPLLARAAAWVARANVRPSARGTAKSSQTQTSNCASGASTLSRPRVRRNPL